MVASRISRFVLAAGAAAVAALFGAGQAVAEEVTLAASHKGSWSQSAPIWAKEQGYFKEEGLDVKIVWTRGGSDAQQAIISNAAQVATQTGILGVVSAFAKGAPIRIIGAAMTGSGGLYWYVSAKSPLKTLKNADGKTMAFSRPGSSTNLVAAALKKASGADIKLHPAGGPTGTLTQVMSGQIDIGWASPPFGLDKVKAGEIRIVAKGDDLPEVSSQTIRVHVANANWLKNNRDKARGLMRALWKGHEYLYKTEEGLRDYVKLAKVDPEIARKVRDEFVPLKSYDFGEIGNMELTIRQALQFKRLDKPLTKAQIDELVQIVYDPKL